MHIGLSTELVTEYLAVLSSSPLFRDLSEEQLRRFLSSPNLSISNYKKNSFIAIAGEPMERDWHFTQRSCSPDPRKRLGSANNYDRSHAVCHVRRGHSFHGHAQLAGHHPNHLGQYGIVFAKIGFHHIIQQLRCLPGADSNQFVA